MRRIALFGFIAAPFISCTPQKTIITPLSQGASLAPRGFIYSLPKTGFEVTLVSVYTTYTPGPYARFAEKYLGIASVPAEPKSEWGIASIFLKSYNEPDMQMLFAVEPTKREQINFTQISETGLVIPLPSARCPEKTSQPVASPNLDSKVVSTDLSHTPFISAERTTLMSRVLQDSAFVRVPVHKTVVVEKNLEDKAREAADFIFVLRKRRFELLSGEADFVAEGKAVETVLTEIRRLEGEYLTLFLGRSTQQYANHTFSYSPQKDVSGTVILCRFSPSKGPVPSSDLSGSPVVATYTIDEEWASLNVISNLALEKGKPRNDAVYYRLPVPIFIRITFGNSELLHKREAAFQFGPLLRMPKQFLY